MERGNTRLKLFDRYLGPIFLLMLAPLRLFRSTRKPTSVLTIGLLKTAAIGDTVILSAITSDLRKAYPEARIVLFAGASNFEFAKLITGISEVVRLPVKNPFAAIRIIRRSKFDLFFDFDPWPRLSALLTALSNSQLRIGFKTEGQHRHFMFDRTVSHTGNRHEIENYRALLTSVMPTLKSPPQTFGHPWLGSGATLDIIVFHLWPSGTRSYLKEWPSKEWIALARELSRIRPYRFVLTGGASDVERNNAFIAMLPADLCSSFSSQAGASFTKTLETLQQASLLVSVNTGIMHVGAAMGVPTVGLHGPTNPRRWGPLGVRTRAVASPMIGAGRLNLGFEYQDDTNFMTGIVFEEVVRASRELLSDSVAR